MRNITEIFKNAISSKIDWTHEVFYSVTERLKNNNFEFSFWDGDENWASILIKNTTKGYIWKKYPIIIFEKNALPNVKKELKEFKTIYYLEVNSLNSELFQIDEELNKYFDNFIDFKSFTIEDLWFQTNSI